MGATSEEHPVRLFEAQSEKGKQVRFESCLKSHFLSATCKKMAAIHSDLDAVREKGHDTVTRHNQFSAELLDCGSWPTFL